MKLESARELSRMFLPDMMSSPKPSWWEKTPSPDARTRAAHPPHAAVLGLCFFLTSWV